MGGVNKSEGVRANEYLHHIHKLHFFVNRATKAEISLMDNRFVAANGVEMPSVGWKKVAMATAFFCEMRKVVPIPLNLWFVS